jgi:hypothetical protein
LIEAGGIYYDESFDPAAQKQNGKEMSDRAPSYHCRLTNTNPPSIIPAHD